MNAINIKYVMFVCLIFLFFGINSALAENEWDFNFSEISKITNVLTEFPTPVLIRMPFGCEFSDCRDVIIRGELPYKLFDLDNNGVPEYLLFIANLNQDDLNRPIKIEYSESPPRIKYENQTIINKWEVCYQKDDATICQWHDNKKDPDINISVQIFPAVMKNRFDLYTIAKFNSSPAVKYFCPLVLDLDNWPRYMVFLLDKKLRGDTEIGVKPALHRIEDLVVYNGRIIYTTVNNEGIDPEEVYDGTLIFVNPNRSIIITKPSIGRFIPSSDYFFKTEILLNGHIQASVCTTNHTGEILPSKGPNAYIVFGEPDGYKLVRMGMNLANIPDPIVHPPESLQTKLFKGSVWPLGKVTSPEIVTKIEFKAEENFFTSLTFTWITQDGIINQTIQSNNGTLVFEQPIILNSTAWKYPFDSYEAIVKIEPPVIKNKNSTLSFESNEPYNGVAKFENNMILFTSRSNDLWYKSNKVDFAHGDDLVFRRIGSNGKENPRTDAES